MALGETLVFGDFVGGAGFHDQCGFLSKKSSRLSEAAESQNVAIIDWREKPFGSGVFMGNNRINKLKTASETKPTGRINRSLKDYPQRCQCESPEQGDECETDDPWGVSQESVRKHWGLSLGKRSLGPWKTARRQRRRKALQPPRASRRRPSEYDSPPPLWRGPWSERRV